MAEQLNLLFINTLPRYLSSVVKIFQANDTEIDYLSLHDHKKIEVTLASDTSWDLIFLSTPKDPPSYRLLTQVAERTEHTPLIFLSKNYDSANAATVMQKGATDYLSMDGLERLIPIAKRELQRRDLANEHLKVSKAQNILSKSGITDRSAEEVFVFDGRTLNCKFADRIPILGYNYSEEKISALKPSDIYSEYDTNSFRQFITPLLENEQEEISICTFVTKRLGRVYPAETHFRKVEHKGLSYIIAINKDSSNSWFKVRKLQRQRGLTQKYIKRNKQKEDLLANAAHDMRASLNTIILSNKLLNKKTNFQLADNCKRLINAIHYSGKHLIQYIDEFFDSTYVQAETNQINKRPISTDALGEELYYIFDPVATEKNLTFTYQHNASDQHTVLTNPTYLKRILKNILSNAFEYTHEGEIRLTIYSACQEELQHIDITSDKAMAFQVQDTGIGIPKSKLSHIFERFSRISQKPSSISIAQGDGLGLDIVQKLTKILGGALHIDSEIGAGSTFTLFLPADGEPTGQLSDQQETTMLPKPTASNKLDKTILVIDDSKMHNLAIKEFLSYSFTKCVTTRSVADAYATLNQQPVDCIILDYILFDTTSDEIVLDLKSHKAFADIPIIIYTGKKLTKREQNILSDHVTAIVQKTASSHNKLVSTLYACLYSETSVNHLSF